VLLATCLHHSLLAHMERADRGLKRQRFAVLRLTRRPSALVECGFLNNHAESAVVATEKWRERLANALVQGLLDYLRVASSGQPPRMIADYTGASRIRFRLQGDRLEPVSAQPRVNIPGRKKP
jgi:N-acetylmuramoyl-L-alanine amidase